MWTVAHSCLNVCCMFPCTVSVLCPFDVCCLVLFSEILCTWMRVMRLGWWCVRHWTLNMVIHLLHHIPHLHMFLLILIHNVMMDNHIQHTSHNNTKHMIPSWEDQTLIIQIKHLSLPMRLVSVSSIVLHPLPQVQPVQFILCEMKFHLIIWDQIIVLKCEITREGAMVMREFETWWIVWTECAFHHEDMVMMMKDWWIPSQLTQEGLHVNVCVTMIPWWDNVTPRGGFWGSGNEEWNRCEMCHEEFSRGVTQSSHSLVLMFMIDSGLLIFGVGDITKHVVFAGVIWLRIMK